MDSPKSVATWRSARFSADVVDIGGPRQVGGQTRIGDRVGLARGEFLLLRHAAPPFFFDRVELAAIHTAAPTSVPMPINQANRPSVTGPSEPRVKPP